METVTLTACNIHGQALNTGSLHFDFENEEITTGKNKKFKVVRDYEFTYKILKTQIKASGGIRGLYDFIKDINRPNSAFNPVLVNLFIEL